MYQYLSSEDSVMADEPVEEYLGLIDQEDGIGLRHYLGIIRLDNIQTSRFQSGPIGIPGVLDESIEGPPVWFGTELEAYEVGGYLKPFYYGEDVVIEPRVSPLDWIYMDKDL
jgi:hypothetical protein